jgi:hypothetical protein
MDPSGRMQAQTPSETWVISGRPGVPLSLLKLLMEAACQMAERTVVS